MLALLVLAKVNWPTVCGPSRSIVKGTAVPAPTIAAWPTPLGGEPLLQLPPTVQLPLEVKVQVGVPVVTAGAAVNRRLVAPSCST